VVNVWFVLLAWYLGGSPLVCNVGLMSGWLNFGLYCWLDMRVFNLWFIMLAWHQGS
jgi:hypothetical protein